MDSRGYQDRIHAQLSGMFDTGATEGTITGGKFAFSEADLVRIRDNWLDLARSYRESLFNADRMARIKPPAEDMASKFHANAANASGEAYRQYLEHNRDYCMQQAQLFEDVLADYLGTEHTNVSDIDKAPQGPQPGM